MFNNRLLDRPDLQSYCPLFRQVPITYMADVVLGFVSPGCRGFDTQLPAWIAVVLVDG